MAFSRPEYDPCAYDLRLKESTGPGRYFLETPAVGGQECDLYEDPRVRVQTRGGAVCPFPEVVDMSTELRGTARPYNRCGAQPQTPCKVYDVRACRSGDMTAEDTRMSNPPCTLREKGWNRWEWLPRNPQGTAMLPFSSNVSNRLLVKDNHRPCVLKPVDPSLVLPGGAEESAPSKWSLDQWAANAGSMALPGAELLNRPHWRTCVDSL